MSVFATNGKITPFLWFKSEAEEAARFYVSIFPHARVLATTTTEHVPHMPPGVLTVDFELDGVRFIALNGNPSFPFTEAVSFAIRCDDQAEVDHFWEKLSEGGKTMACGWLKDRYGVAWQVTPKQLPDLIRDPRGMAAMMKMVKIDIAEIERAVQG